MRTSSDHRSTCCFSKLSLVRSNLLSVYSVGLLCPIFAAHPHTSLSLPAMRALALKPILFTQVPALDTVLAKLSSFIDSATWFSGASKSQEHVKQTLSSTIFPYLKSRFSPADPSKPLPTATPKMLVSWAELTTILSNALPLVCYMQLISCDSLVTSSYPGLFVPGGRLVAACPPGS